MATLKIRGESYSVIYLYTAADGQKKQQWETYVTELEALQRKTYIEYLQKNKMKKELPPSPIASSAFTKKKKKKGFFYLPIIASLCLQTEETTTPKPLASSSRSGFHTMYEKNACRQTPMTVIDLIWIITFFRYLAISS